MGPHAYQAASALVPLLKDGGAAVREKTAWALGRIGDDVAVEPLIEAIKDKEAAVRAAVAVALKELTGEDLGEDQAKWKKWLEENQ